MTIFASLILLFFAISIFISNNPWGVKATNGCVSDTVDGIENCTLNVSESIGVLYDGKDVLITNNAVITVTGSHAFNNLTIDTGSTINHPVLTTGENSSSNKKVDLTITDKLTIRTGGKIDVSGKGYLGGVQPSITDGPRGNNGGGTGFGPFAFENGSPVHWINTGGGGGSHGVLGGASYTSKDGFVTDRNIYELPSGGPVYDTGDSGALDYGSGGGSGKSIRNPTTLNSNMNTSAAGGSGGGRIKIVAKTIDMQGTAKMWANGSDGQEALYPYSGSYLYTSGGGGAGGSINIDADKIIISKKAPYISPTGGTGLNTGTNSTVLFPGVYKTNDLAGLIQANGGSGRTKGGGGGAGSVLLNLDTVEEACYLTTGDTSIPASCEERDVVIDGVEIKAEAVAVTQGTSTDCTATGVNVASCDSRRTFTSLTIKNNGKLTHSAITIPEMSQDLDNNKSLAAETAGTARWKKVDIVVIGNGSITLESGGKIDTIGKGYPGGEGMYGFKDYSVRRNGYGPGGGSGQYAGGSCLPDNDHAVAGAGSYGGSGGTSCNGRVVNAYPGTYDHTRSQSNFDFGSGGGGVYNPVDGYNAVVEGNSGGGRISLEAKSIIINNQNSKITADGNIGTFGQDTKGSTHGGAGSGGTIWIKTGHINYPGGTGSMIVVTADAGFSWDYNSPKPIGQPGPVDINGIPNTSNIFNISARGGAAYDHGSSGGGGRILIDFPGEVNLKKTLSPVSRGGIPNIQFNPYALQKNDIIKIDLLVSNAIGRTIISDEALSVPYSSPENICAIITANPSYPVSLDPILVGPTFTAVSDNITLNFNAIQSDRIYNFSYYCQVN